MASRLKEGIGNSKNGSNAAEFIEKKREIAAFSGELQKDKAKINEQDDSLLLTASLLEKEREKFASFFNLAPIAYFIVDQYGKIIMVNLLGQKLLGLTKEEILQQPIQQFIHQDNRNNFNKFQQTLRPNHVKHSLHLTLLPKNRQEVYARIEGTAIFDDKNNEMQYYIAIIDLTKSKMIAQAMEQLEEEKQKLILSTSFNAQERERSKISSVLHDSICQLLYGIRLNLNHIQLLNKGVEFDAINQLIAQSIKEVRELSYELTPSVLRDFGLVAGVKEMVDRISTPHFQISLQIDKTTDKLDSEVQLAVFRIIQELLNNCIKHAEATKIDVQVKYKDDMLCIRVCDNGIGLTSGIEKALRKGSGLRGIKNRVSLLNGLFVLKKPKKGTDILIKIPLEKLD